MSRWFVMAVACIAPAVASSVSSQSQVLPSPERPGGAPAPPQTQWTLLTQSMTVGSFFSTSWSSNLPYDLTFQITDLHVASDRFEVYDNGVLILTTPAVPDWDAQGAPDPFASPPYEYDPNAAFASGLFSSASIVLGGGPHLITIRDIHIPPTSAGGPPFGDASVAFRTQPVCASISATVGALRDTIPPQGAQLQPFSQDRVVIGSGPGSSVAPPDVQFFPPSPGAPALLAWAIASAPDNIPVSGLGTFLVSVTYPDPLAVVIGFYPTSDVVSADFVPNECALVGIPIYTQGAVLQTSGPMYLTNAIDYVIGLL